MASDLEMVKSNSHADAIAVGSCLPRSFDLPSLCRSSGKSLPLFTRFFAYLLKDWGRIGYGTQLAEDKRKTHWPRSE
jgi:hypothetical protein